MPKTLSSKSQSIYFVIVNVRKLQTDAASRSLVGIGEPHKRLQHNCDAFKHQATRQEVESRAVRREDHGEIDNLQLPRYFSVARQRTSPWGLVSIPKGLGANTWDTAPFEDEILGSLKSPLPHHGHNQCNDQDLGCFKNESGSI